MCEENFSTAIDDFHARSGPRFSPKHGGNAYDRLDKETKAFKRTKGVRAAERSGGYQEAMILVKGGYTPDTIIVSRGKPARFNFLREETASCSDKVVFEYFRSPRSAAPGKPWSGSEANVGRGAPAFSGCDIWSRDPAGGVFIITLRGIGGTALIGLKKGSRTAA